MAHRRLAERGGLFHRHVGHQHRVDADAGALGIERIDARAEDEVGIHQQADWDGRMLLADRRQHLKALRRGHSRGEGAQGRALDGRAVRQRVGERDPQFKGIGAAFDQRIDNFQRLLRSRIAKGDKGDEGAFLAIFQLGKQRLIAFHQISPRAFRMSCTVKMSLSPRPERFTTSSCSFSGFSRIIFSAWARA